MDVKANKPTIMLAIFFRTIINIDEFLHECFVAKPDLLNYKNVSDDDFENHGKLYSRSTFLRSV